MSYRLHVTRPLVALSLLGALAAGCSDPRKATPSPASSTTTTSADSRSASALPLASCNDEVHGSCKESYAWRLDEKAAQKDCVSFGGGKWLVHEGCPTANLLGVCSIKRAGSSDLVEKQFRYRTSLGASEEEQRKRCEAEGFTWVAAAPTSPVPPEATMPAGKSAPAAVVPKKGTKR